MDDIFSVFGYPWWLAFFWPSVFAYYEKPEYITKVTAYAIGGHSAPTPLDLSMHTPTLFLVLSDCGREESQQPWTLDVL